MSSPVNCVYDSLQVLENIMNPYGKQVLAKGSSHPCMDMYSHPARTIRHWLSHIVGWLFIESNNTAGKCLLHYTYISVAELSLPLRSHHDDFFPSPNGANPSAWLIVSDVNYRTCAFVHSGACLLSWQFVSKREILNKHFGSDKQNRCKQIQNPQTECLNTQW